MGAGAVPALAVGALPATATAASLPTLNSVPPELKVIDTAMRKYIAERGIKSAQIAVARRGKILMAVGYGRYAVVNPDTGAALGQMPVRPTTLFRIASLSKHITSAAVMRLVQDGKLKLSDPVTTLLGLSATADPRLKQVTVLRLMQNLGGWDREVSKDPLWLDHTIASTLKVPLPIGHDAIIRYVTARPLDFAPGSKMVYSNYGYMLLGRIIARVSGMSYEAYVQRKLLAPVGITRMRLGRSLQTEISSREVDYQSGYTTKTVVDASGKVVPFPYGGFNMPNQDANGGWVGSAVDLVKFGMVFDGPGPVLNATSIGRLLAKPETGVTASGSWYGGGWWVRSNGTGLNTWHNGSMPGTYTFVARVQNGVSYCALFNRRAEEGTPEFESIDPVLGRAVGAVTRWPTTDLTPRFF
ncbi:hypothetical protein Ssi02_03310 [Sinosporangium siamense]|uniref:Beta-lactamase-related domain-containing protein n=2 Tax=Sinosporangium siamense TaxID=1367973 RepID=A0A919R9X7_9ACTN|nr:hypothetical protein Ssi02_03310 [Sinosporangium siamense]